MAFFHRKSKPSEDSEQFDNYVENLVSDSDPDITREIDSHFSSTPHYGIDDAVKLMQRLPDNDTDMVIGVVRETLHSANIDVGTIIHDADTRLCDIEQTIASLSREIEDLRAQVAEKKTAIDSAQQDLAEIKSVKELLEKSQKLANVQAHEGGKSDTPPSNVAPLKHTPNNADADKAQDDDATQHNPDQLAVQASQR